MHEYSGELSSDPNGALHRLWAVAVLLADDMDQGLSQSGLTRARATLLWELYHHGPVNQREISRLLDVTPRNVTALVDALQKDNYVTREPQPTDRRATQVTLTDDGDAAVATMHTQANELAADLFSDLPAADLATFADVLKHITTRLSALTGKSVPGV